MKNLLFTFFAIVCVSSSSGQSFTTEKWLDDDLTIAFGTSSKIRHRMAFSGVRIIYEPQFGIVNSRGDNRIKVQQFSSLPKFALEFNLVNGWVAAQPFYLFSAPVEFDDQSPVLTNNVINTADHKVDVDYGLGIGLTFLDGLISIGTGKLHFDTRDFDKDNSDYKSNMLTSSFFFVNIQPVSAIRKFIKSGRSARATNTPLFNSF